MDRHRLWTKPTVTKRSLSKKNIMSSTNSSRTCPTMNRLRKSAICGEIGSAISSPDSRWRRFFDRDCSSKIWSKSHWPIFAWLIQCEIPLSLVSFEFLCREMVRVSLFCKFVHLYALLFRPTDCKLWFTIDLVSEKSIVNTFEMLTLRVNSFAASLPRIPGCMVLFLFFSFAVTSTMATPFLDHVVRDRESIQS